MRVARLVLGKTVATSCLPVERRRARGWGLRQNEEERKADTRGLEERSRPRRESRRLGVDGGKNGKAVMASDDGGLNGARG